MSEIVVLTTRHAEPVAALQFDRVVVMGGGCYGSWYAQQIARALTRGAMTANDVVIVDHAGQCKVARQLAEGAYDGLPIRHEEVPWTEYLATWFARPAEALAGHAMVPSPLMPHLCFEWLMARAASRWPEREVRAEPLVHAPATPWERASPDHRHYVSFATWMCPVNCIEPARCPHTRGVRDWSMPEAMREFARNDPTLDCAAIFPCVHRTFGVGMIDVAPIVRADVMLAERGAHGGFRALVGTTSHCHGALGVLAVR